LHAPFVFARLARRADIHVVDSTEQAAARGLPLPHVDHVAIGVVEAAPLREPWIVGGLCGSEIETPPEPKSFTVEKMTANLSS
jgi:hypothetical protein